MADDRSDVSNPVDRRAASAGMDGGAPDHPMEARQGRAPAFDAKNRIFPKIRILPGDLEAEVVDFADRNNHFGSARTAGAPCNTDIAAAELPVDCRAGLQIRTQTNL